MSGYGPAGEIYFEFQPLGRQVKVTAIDAATGVEVSIIAPVQAARSDMEQIALRKLQRRLAEGRG